jgi:hypothetical protein
MQNARIATADDWRRLARDLPKPPARAFPPDTRIEKVMMDEGDLRPIGTQGTVVVPLPAMANLGMAYIVVWDDMPGLCVLVAEQKIHKVQVVH